MKILIIHTYNYLRGGDSRYAIELQNLLETNGHKVFFWGMKHPKSRKPKEYDYYVDHIDYAELNDNKSIFNILKVIIRSIWSKSSQKKIKKILKIAKPDIVHLNNIHAHITPSILPIIKKFKIPIVWTLHDYKLICPNTHLIIDKNNQICDKCVSSRQYYYCLIQKCKKNSYGASFLATIEAYFHKLLNIEKYIDKFIVPSRFLQQKLINSGVSESKIIRLPYFVTDQSSETSNNNKSYILFFGRLNKIKGTEIVFKIAEIMQDKSFLFVGPVNKDVECLFKKKYNNITFLGFQESTSLKKIILNSYLVLVPSLWHDNFPFTVLESFSFGKPVISSNLGGLKEMIGEDERGFSLDPYDVTGYCEKINLLYNDERLYNVMSKNAISFVRNLCNEKKHYESLIEIYNLVKK